MSVQGEYRRAAVCARGHLQTSNIANTEIGKRCPTCGADVLIECADCKTRIRGDYYIPGFMAAGGYEVPDFCDNCGRAFPWVGRAGLIYELQNRLGREQLDPADALVVREQLEALLNPDLDEQEQVKRWTRVKELAPKLWDGSKPLLEIAIQAGVKAAIPS